MFNAKYDNPLDSFILNNPNFSRTDLENHLESLRIYTGKTPDRSINRDVLKYLRKNFPEFEKLTTKEVKKTKDEIISDDDFARDDFVDRDFDIWYKKILKTGETKNPKWKTSTDIEAVTFEKLDCNTNRFQDMLDSITDNIMEISYIDKAGYDCERIGADFIDEQAQYPNIKVTFTNAGGVTTKYIP